MNKINIIYRCCENEVLPPFKPHRPLSFNKIRCFKSLIDSISINNILVDNFIVLYDGDTGILHEYIIKHISKIPHVTLDIHEAKYLNNEKSLLRTYELSNSLSNKNIYFVEDDYLHLPNAIRDINEGIFNFHLVTGYDHFHRYEINDDISKGKDYIEFMPLSFKHWRTCESTCCTWGCHESIYDKMIRYANQYKLEDHAMFRNLNIKENIRLWNPIPGVTTQVDKNLSPGINWELFNNTIIL